MRKRCSRREPAVPFFVVTDHGRLLHVKDWKSAYEIVNLIRFNGTHLRFCPLCVTEKCGRITVIECLNMA